MLISASQHPQPFSKRNRTQITERHRAQAVSFFLGTRGGGHKTYAYDIETPTPRCPAKIHDVVSRSSVIFVLPSVEVVYSQCERVPLSWCISSSSSSIDENSFPPRRFVSIPRTSTCTFAEAIQANGNCPTYTDTTTLIDPTREIS